MLRLSELTHFTPEPYQQEGIDWLCKNRYSILADDMGLGKTFQFVAMALLMQENTVIVCPAYLKSNWEQELEKMIKRPEDRALFTVTSYSKAKDLIPLLESTKAKIIGFDECFDDKTEILTSEGFKPFPQLVLKDKVAEVCGESLELNFTTPNRIVKNPYEGMLLNIESSKGVSIVCTPNHQLLVEFVSGERGKIPAKDLNPTHHKYLYLAGKGVGSDTTLTPLEKLLIAAQADGSIHNKGRSLNTQFSFSFSKPRKIKAFLDLMEFGGFNYSEVKGSRNKRRFIVRVVEGYSKEIFKFFELSSLSQQKSKAIIDYMVLWDGFEASETCIGYSNTCKESSDFYQAVATLAGYKTKQVKIVDTRKEAYKDCYKLSIVKNKYTVSVQSLSITETPYTGFVYCATVPKGNIVIKREGKVVVVGNCHYLKTIDAQRTQYSLNALQANPMKRIVLMSGTPIKNRVPEWYVPLMLIHGHIGSDFQERFPSEWSFSEFFCKKHVFQVKNRMVTKYFGVMNREILLSYVRPIMLRRLAKDVLGLEDPHYYYLEANIKGVDDEGLIAAFETGKDSKAKRLSALSKVKYTAKHLKDLHEPFIMFTGHPEVAQQMSELVKGCGVITGNTPVDKRQQIVNDFQNGKYKGLLLTIGAASTGYTMTRASIVVFNDLSYITGDNDQAIARSYRKGQENAVRVYMVGGSKVDAMINKALIQKAKDLKQGM